MEKISMQARQLRSKKAALELSMSTIIIIVLGVMFLILGIVLLRGIFGVATKSITNIDDQLSGELRKIFTDGEDSVVIYLNDNNLAKIRAGTTNFGILIAAQTANNLPIDDATKVQYKLELIPETSIKSCYKLLGETKTKALFRDSFDTWLDSYDGDGAVSRKIIYLSIPGDTRLCTQQVRVTVIDRTADSTGEVLGFKTFSIEILRKGLF